jgi:4-hydroxybenzoate polyprenyltransferase
MQESLVPTDAQLADGVPGCPAETSVGADRDRWGRSGSFDDQGPLCVDLDGTLVRTDLLVEALFALLRQNPLYLLLLPLWLVRGKAAFKHEVCRRANLNVAVLPYNQPLLARLRDEHRAGRRIVLATAADRAVAEQVAAHLGVFSDVLASDGRVNLSGRKKRDALVREFGPGGFDYAGNAGVDLPIWAECRRAIVVNAPRRVAGKAARVADVAAVIDDRPSPLRAMLRAMRPHQWAKNVLVFVPLLTSHQLTDLGLLISALCAFLAFGFCASSVYLLNDLLDLEADRQHHKKKSRPFAAGDLSLGAGVVLCGALLGAGIGLSLLLPGTFQLVLALYYALTIAYSFYLKGKLLLDVHCLGALYTIRVLAGSAATGIAPSQWLLAFCLFFFLSLALVKRVSEVQQLLRDNLEAARGRSYRASDLQALGSLGTGSGFICVLILALYIQSPQVTALYKTPAVLWMLCPLFTYWMSRVWMIAYRGKMNHDPVVFALKDRVSYLVGLGAAAIMFVAALGWPAWVPSAGP